MSAPRLAHAVVCASAALSLGAILSCSAVTNVDNAPCTSVDDCRLGFGLGWTCNSDSGFCEEAEASPLCAAFPDDLLTDRDKYPGDTILFATLLDGEGDRQMVNSANLAVLQVNTVDGGGLEGRKFGMINCTYGDDSNTDDQLAKAREAARYAVDAYGVQAIIGPGTSSLALEVYNEVKDQVLIISPSATSDTLTYIDGTNKSAQNPGLFWRSVPPDSGIAARIADLLISDGRTRVGMIYKDNAYGQNLADLLGRSLNPQGLTPPPVELIAYSYDDGTYGDAVVKLSETADLEEVVFVSDSADDVVTFLTSVAGGSGSLATVGLVFSDSAFSETNVLNKLNADVITKVIDPGRARLLVPNAPSGPVFDIFRENYMKAFDNDSPANAGYTAESYDAAWMAILGSAWSLYNEDGIKPRGMAAGLHFISDVNATAFDITPAQWASIRGSFASGSAVNIRGASGELDYDSSTEETTGAVELYAIVNNGGALEYQLIP
ncbi:MAG: ABC transporter substrate-binding protein [Nannocystaceae bacterium]